MIVVKQIQLSGSTLSMTCVGDYGVGSNGNPSGEVVRSTLEQALQDATGEVLSVTIDFSDVIYVWGDGPTWSVLPAVERGLRVKYLAGQANLERLSNLMSETRFIEWVEVVLKEH